jgi:hypothetical protein
MELMERRPSFEKCIQTIRDSPTDKILEIAAHYDCFIVGPPILDQLLKARVLPWSHPQP